MKTIAIVDDDIYIGDMLEDLLHREGYATLRAYSGTEALYLLSQHKPDLVLLDLMPQTISPNLLTQRNCLPALWRPCAKARGQTAACWPLRACGWMLNPMS